MGESMGRVGVSRPGRRRGSMKNLNVNVWAVHLLTSSGAALSFAAAIAAEHKQWQLVFLFLGIAMIVDGIDGPIARWLDVTKRLPWFDGAILDLVVDYTTYVLIPALVLAESGLLTEPYIAAIAGIVVVVVGALYFADKRMKTEESAFRGFPAVWNAVVFQLMVYKFPERITLLVVAAFAVLTFLPVEFVHPVRVKRLRGLTLTMAALWGVLAVVSLAENLDPGPVVVTLFALCSLYFALIGVFLQVTQPATEPQ
jgi:phosphatidylcholine synthase